MIEAQTETTMVQNETTGIQTTEDAEKALDEILTLREKAARIKAACLARIEEAEAEAKAAEDTLGMMLEVWCDNNAPTTGKKTWLLNTGKISRRTVKGGLRIENKAAVLEWAKANCPEAVEVETVEKLKADAVKEHCAFTGEVPEGLIIKEDREEIYFGGAK